MKRSNMFSLALLLLPFLVESQTNYYSIAETSALTLNSWYRSDIGLWGGGTGWWNSANCLTVQIDLALVDGNVVSSVTSQLENTFQQAQQQNANGGIFTKRQIGAFNEDNENTFEAATPTPNGFINDFYDDEGWWALAWIDAYDLTQNQTYLDTAINIFLDMTHGWPTNCSNGGVWWNKDVGTADEQVNAIANELYISVAAHLANRDTPSKQAWTNWANEALTWFRNSGLINSENLINDHLTNCVNDGTQAIWTYNQGVILGALVELNTATGDASLLTQAQTLANAAIANLTDSNYVLHEPACEPDGCDDDSSQFKGVFIRNLAKLQKAAPSDTYSQVIVNSANSVWAERNSNGMLPADWSGGFEGTVNATTQSSGMDALVGAIQVQ